jgi:hypothetical protein
MTWPARRSKVVHPGGDLQWLIGAAAAQGRVRAMAWCGVEGRKRERLRSAVRSSYSRKRWWHVFGAATVLSGCTWGGGVKSWARKGGAVGVHVGRRGEAVGAETWWWPLSEG